MNPPEELISFKEVSLKIKETTILEKISFTVKENDTVTIIGANGAGKTSLLKILLKLIQPTSGALLFHASVKIGYVPQKIPFNPFLPMPVSYLLKLSSPNFLNDLGVFFDFLKIKALKSKNFFSLSGGEQQKVLLARTILRKPNLLVLDEPTQGFDFTAQNEFYGFLEMVKKLLKCSVILVSHDLHWVMASSTHVICLNKHICCSGTPEHVAQSPYYHHLLGKKPAIAPYTHHHTHSHDI